MPGAKVTDQALAAVPAKRSGTVDDTTGTVGVPGQHVERHGDGFLADAEEAADADHHRAHPPVPGEAAAQSAGPQTMPGAKVTDQALAAVPAKRSGLVPEFRRGLELGLGQPDLGFRHRGVGPGRQHGRAAAGCGSRTFRRPRRSRPASIRATRRTMR
jgi:hypothetical protein